MKELYFCDVLDIKNWDKKATILGLLIGYRKGNKLIFLYHFPTYKCIGCKVDEKDEMDVYKWSKKNKIKMEPIKMVNGWENADDYFKKLKDEKRT